MSGKSNDPHYLSLIRIIAGRLYSSRTSDHLAYHLEFHELISEGWIGLQSAHARFDPSRGTKFKTFAEYRIRGAMIDAIRKYSHMGSRHHPLAAFIPFDTCAEAQDRTVPPTSLLELETYQFITPLLAPLTPRERDIIVRFYLKGDHMAEIASDLGVSEPYMSLFLKKIRLKLNPDTSQHLHIKNRL